jgi:hypothetical protein
MSGGTFQVSKANTLLDQLVFENVVDKVSRTNVILCFDTIHIIRGCASINVSSVLSIL